MARLLPREITRIKVRIGHLPEDARQRRRWDI
jgi:hypothetical protein